MLGLELGANHLRNSCDMLVFPVGHVGVEPKIGVKPPKMDGL